MVGRAFRRLREVKKALPACSHAGLARGLKLENRLAEKKEPLWTYERNFAYSRLHTACTKTRNNETKRVESDTTETSETSETKSPKQAKRLKQVKNT